MKNGLSCEIPASVPINGHAQSRLCICMVVSGYANSRIMLYTIVKSFLSRLYEIFLSIKDLENLAEFNLLRNLQLCTQNLFAPQTSDLLEKLELIFLYNFHREHSLLKLIAENQCENHKKSNLVLIQPRKTCPYITERLLMGRKESNQTKNKTNPIRIESQLEKNQSKMSSHQLLYPLPNL